MARQGETDTGVKAHSLFAASYEIRELNSFGVPHVRTAEQASALGLVEFVEKLSVDGRVLQDLVDDGTHRDRCCVASHNAISRQKSNQTQEYVESCTVQCMTPPQHPQEENSLLCLSRDGWSMISLEGLDEWAFLL